MLPEPYTSFCDALRAFIPAERIYTDPLRTLAYGTDASFYRLTPKVVVDVLTEEEVVLLLAAARQYTTPVTFRAAGTSLSGQGVTDSVLVRINRGWRNHRVHAEATAITLQPGVIGAEANAILAPLGKKIGPDPASIDTCMIGGIAANNASGMCCGVADNSYKTLLSARLILADGTLVDTGDAASRAAFTATNPHILAGLSALRSRVMADTALAERIRKKFRIKNTTGYSINALVDFEDPFAILQHLMVGSEGTLGFIAEVTYRTVDDLPFKASALMLFDSIPEACRAAAILREEPVSAAEIMDRASLRSVQGKPGVPEHIAGLGDEVCSLLVETRAVTKAECDAQVTRITASVTSLGLAEPVRFTGVPAEYASLWQVRKGILPSVGAVRTPGDTCIIEDVAVPLESLADAAQTLRNLFAKHGYTEGVIFGHARDGNLHFVFNQNFGNPAEVARYAAFMDEVCAAIAHNYDGSLKAEHGTGRNIAPYVELEWGAQALGLMREIKTLLDPHAILNPGVILNENPTIHLENLKPLTPTHEHIDPCSECGFCEPTCPSRGLSLTPRQRIASWREITRQKDPALRGNLLRALEGSYTYQGKDTCAADGLCALRCPAKINTGTFIKHLRAEQNGLLARKTARGISNHFRATCLGASVLLRSVDAVHRLLGTRILHATSRAVRVVSMNTLPAWNKAMPGAAPGLPKTAQPSKGSEKTIVYFPSCVSRVMGPDRDAADRRSEAAIVTKLLQRAGYQVVYPEKTESLCCGMAFASKGFTSEATERSAALNAALLAVSKNGRYPVLCETSPCLLHMRETLDPRLALYEPVTFALEFLVPVLSFAKLPRKVAVHATCSTRKMGLAEKLADLATLCAEQVVVPEGIACCGFAGDRGFTHPELNESALRGLRFQVSGCDAGYSTSRTCQIGLTLHSGIPYMSILALVEEASRKQAAH